MIFSFLPDISTAKILLPEPAGQVQSDQSLSEERHRGFSLQKTFLIQPEQGFLQLDLINHLKITRWLRYR